MKVTITVEMHNEAFEYDPGAELTRILIKLGNYTREIAPTWFEVPDQRRWLINKGSIPLLDLNGNIVGYARFSE